MVNRYLLITGSLCLLSLKPIQVIAFLYTAMRCVDLGLKTALIVTPVNVLHNWRSEFVKWGPSEVKPLRIFMLEDVSRYKFFYERSFWYLTI